MTGSCLVWETDWVSVQSLYEKINTVSCIYSLINQGNEEQTRFVLSLHKLVNKSNRFFVIKIQPLFITRCKNKPDTLR